MAGTLYIISAASGTGKTSLVNALVERIPNLVISTSYTTRKKRTNEVHSKHYYFVSQAEFDTMASRKDFLEYATVFGNSYGTSKEQVEQLLQAGKDVILEIDWQGAQYVRKRIADVESIFILPPSKEALRERIISRGQNKPEEIEGRLATATEDISHYNEFDYLIVNDHFDEAVKQLEAIILANRCRQSTQQKTLKDLLTSIT